MALKTYYPTLKQAREQADLLNTGSDTTTWTTKKTSKGWITTIL